MHFVFFLWLSSRAYVFIFNVLCEVGGSGGYFCECAVYIYIILYLLTHARCVSRVYGL